MTQRIRWNPASSPNIIAYRLLYTDEGPNGTFAPLVEIMNMLAGVNYDLTSSTFFYDDQVGDSYRLYRMNTLDTYGNVFADDTVPAFNAGNDPVNVPVANVYPMTENTGGTNNLGYISSGGTPIADATVRVYTKLNWDLRRYNQVVGSTSTNAVGGWRGPVFVEPGNTFVVVFTKPNLYGEDAVEITV